MSAIDSSKQRNDYYIKYKTSGIFKEHNAPADKSQKVTSKVNSVRVRSTFTPKYKEQEPKQRYLKEYWNIDNDNSAKGNLCNKTMDEGLLINNSVMDISLNEKGNNKEYTARNKYQNEFFANNLLGMLPSIHERAKCSFERSKSGYQIKPSVKGLRDGNDDLSSKQKKIESLHSNIFHQKDKDKSITHIDQSQLRKRENSGKQKLDTIEKQFAKKVNSKVPTAFDWKHTNTEGNKNRNSLNRSKTTDPSIRKQQELLSSIDTDEAKQKMLNDHIQNNTINSKNGTSLGSSSNKAIDVRPNRQLVQKYPQDKEIESFEIQARDHFDTVDSGKVKQLFLEKGIHIYNFEEDGSSVNGYQSGKIRFKIRKDKNDHDICKKIALIEKDIKSLGLDLRKAVNDNMKKKERKPTPGKELLKKNNALCQDKMRNIAPQSNKGYKNHYIYEKKNK